MHQRFDMIKNLENFARMVSMHSIDFNLFTIDIDHCLPIIVTRGMKIDLNRRKTSTPTPVSIFVLEETI